MIISYILFFLLLSIFEYICIMSVYLGTYSLVDFKCMCVFLPVNVIAFDCCSCTLCCVSDYYMCVLGVNHSDCILSDCCLHSRGFQCSLVLLFPEIYVCSFVPALSIITYSCKTAYCQRYAVTYIVVACGHTLTDAVVAEHNYISLYLMIWLVPFNLVTHFILFLLIDFSHFNHYYLIIHDGYFK